MRSVQKFLLACSAAVALAFAATPASAFILQFDENGNGCLISGEVCTPVNGFLAPDPTHRVDGNVLIYQLPSFVTAGDVGIDEFGSNTLSDILSFTNVDGTLTGATANLMIFYSELGGGAAADSGFPCAECLSANFVIGTSENAAGNFDWEPFGNSYLGLSPEGVPEPITFSLFGAGLAGVAAARRRKAKSA